jgi:hypothetical protein
MRRHNKKGNGFYKIAKTTPKYISIDAAIVKVAQNYLRKMAEAPADGAPNPDISNPTGSAEETTAPLPTDTSAKPEIQTAPQLTVTESPTPREPEEASQASEGTPTTEPSSGGQSVGKPSEGVAQETKPQSADVSSAPGDAASSQPGAVKTEKTEVTSGTEKKTDVVEAPAKEQPPNYLKNLALLIGVPLTIASLAGGAIRGFNMSNLIGLGLGAVATVYGFGFLDSILHPKAMLHEEIEDLKRREAVTRLKNRRSAEWTIETIFGSRQTLSDLPRDYVAETVPDEFKEIYDLSQGYIMRLYQRVRPKDDLLPYIFGFASRGASPDMDMKNSLNRKRDLERHATIIVLANLLKQVEESSPEEGEDKAANLLIELVRETPPWFSYYFPLARHRPSLADPITFAEILDRKSADLHRNYGIDVSSIKGKLLAQHLSEVASRLDPARQKTQAR